MNYEALKTSLRIAKANYRSAVARGDATTARKALEEVAFLKQQKKIAKAAADHNDVLARAKKSARKQARKYVQKAHKSDRAAIEKAVLSGHIKPPTDPELEQIRYLRGLVDHKEAGMRTGALEKLRALLSADELADVLTHRPEQITRGGVGKSEQEHGEERLGRMVRDLANPTTSPTDRAEIIDRLVKATEGDPKASDALAQIMQKVR